MEDLINLALNGFLTFWGAFLIIKFDYTDYLLEWLMKKNAHFFVKLFTCTMCLSFWLGLIVYQDIKIALVGSFTAYLFNTFFNKNI